MAWHLTAYTTTKELTSHRKLYYNRDLCTVSRGEHDANADTNCIFVPVNLLANL